MKKACLILSGALTLVGVSIAPDALAWTRPAAVGPKVTVTAERQHKKTILPPTKTRGEKSWITRGGTPRGKCSGDTAAGALDAATHGWWTGKYYASVGGIFITSIRGVRPSKNRFWGIFVGKHLSSKGICQVKLKAGQQLLFKIVK